MTYLKSQRKLARSLLKVGTAVLLLLVLVSVSFSAVSEADSGSQMGDESLSGGTSGLGPGGVGTTDGTSNLKAWWAADKDTYSDNGCTVPAVHNGRVICWLDQSGNNRHATSWAFPASPVYKTSYLNNLPVLYGSPGSYNTQLDFDGTFLAGSDYTVFAVEGRTADFFYKYYMGGSGSINAALVLGYRYGDTLTMMHYHGGGLDATVPPFAGQQFTIQAFTLNQTVGREIFYLGNSIASDTQTTPLPSFNGAALFRHPSGANTYQGDIAEIIIYDRALNATERMMVENYLSSKYSVDLDTSGGAIDVFEGDLIVRGDFDYDMAGIISFGGLQQTEAHSAGIIVRDIDFLQDDGDWLTFAHRDAVSGNTTDDLPTTSDWSTAPDPRRWLRHWYFDRTDAAGTSGGTVDIIFDLDEGRMTNAGYPPTGPVSNYRLLGRSADSGDFSDVTAASGATVALAGNQIQFLGVDVAILGSNFTVGTLNYSQSPTALTLADVRTTQAEPLGYIFAGLLLFMGLLTAVILRGREVK